MPVDGGHPHSLPEARKGRARLGLVAAAAVGGLLLSGCSGSAATSETPAAEVDLEALSVTEQANASAPGEYAVGRRSITVTDPAREGRSFPIDIWYPVDPAAAAGATPSEYSLAPGLGYTSTTALADAPVAGGDFPVVVYSHGGGGFRWIATFYTEFLASKGYVVVAPDHPGSTAVDQLTGGAVDREQNAFLRPADITLTLDSVLAANETEGDPLQGSMDETKIALSGHSWGGYTSIATVAGHTNALGSTTPDDRINSLILMAPYTEMLSDEELQKVDVPVLVVSSTLDESTPIETNTVRPAELMPGRPLVRVDIDGGAHTSFTDVCKLRDAVATIPDVPEAVTNRLNEGSEEACGAQAMPIGEIQQIVNSYSVAFLSDTLQDSSEFNAMLQCIAPPEKTTCTSVTQ